MTGHQSQHPRSGRVCRLAASAALLAMALWPTLGSVTGATAAVAVNTVATPGVTETAGATPAPEAETVTVSLTSITPATALPGTPVTILGTVRNAGPGPITSPVVRALIGTRPLTSREDVSGWDLSTDEQPEAAVARTTLGQTLAPGSVTMFALTIPATAISHSLPFAVLPLRVAVVGTTSDASSVRRVLGAQRSFLPTLASIKKYEPVSIAWLVPLTLDPDPALHGVDSAARTAAWTKAIGPGSRLDRLIAGTDSTKVTWAIDPAILGPPPAPVPVASPTAPGPAPSASSPPAPGSTTHPDPVAEATSALARRLKSAAPRHTLWSLPYADPDLSALLPLSPGNGVLTAVVHHPSALEDAVGPARTDIAWPVDGTMTLTTGREGQLQRAFASQGLTARVTSASTLTTPNGRIGDASRKSSGGLGLLAYDDALSRTFTQTSSAALGATAIQRFLADSMALLGERPGTANRTVLVAAPRSFAGDPTVLRAFFAAIAQAPWLTPTSTEELLTAIVEAAPEVRVAGGKGRASTSPPASPTDSPTDLPTASPTAPDPLLPGTSPLTSARLRAIPETRAAITGVAGIQDDAGPFQSRWEDAQDQLLSVRWRGNPGGPAAIGAATGAAVTAVSRGVRVAPSSVNFFADRGVLQVTVVNDLAVPVHNVRLTLTPAQPRLLIEKQPEPLKIGAKSRTNVRLNVTAIAAGLVPIEAVLTTSNGTPLGQRAVVDVRVQPTSTWVFWVLGGLAGVVLVLGSARSLRRGTTRASRPSVQEPLFDD